jgi:hypothetical protein
MSPLLRFVALNLFQAAFVDAIKEIDQRSDQQAQECMDHALIHDG